MIAAVPVIITLLFAGKLGGAALNGLMVTAPMVGSVALDHFGLAGFHVHAVNSWRQHDPHARVLMPSRGRRGRRTGPA